MILKILTTHYLLGGTIIIVIIIKSIGTVSIRN